MKHLRNATVLAALALAGACGGGGGASGQCEDLVEVTCERTVECIGGGTVGECVDAVLAQLPCDQADRVGPTYDSCVDQLMTATCGDLFPVDELVLPTDCNDVIIIE